MKYSISILGCGWYGFALAKVLIEEGFTVKGSTTSVSKLQLLAGAGIGPYLVDFSSDSDNNYPQFFDGDLLVIAIPPKIRSGNQNGYHLVVQRILSAIKLHNVKQVVFISSTGVYGDLNKTVNELSSPSPDNLSGQALLTTEQLFMRETAFTTTVLRFGGLIGPGRHPGRFFAGKTAIPNGKAPVNLIHLTDCVGISLAIIIQQAFGFIFNACTPHHPSKADFYTQATANVGLIPPDFIDELNNWKIVESINVPRILNYQYQVADLMKWLNE